MKKLCIGMKKMEGSFCRSRSILRDRAELPDGFTPAKYIRDNYPGWTCTGFREIEVKS
jgi:hypothetical protein